MSQAPPPPRRTWPWVVVLILLAAIAGLAAYLFLNLGDSGGTPTSSTAAQVTMPSVIGFQADAAIAALTDAGFKVTQEHTLLEAAEGHRDQAGSGREHGRRCRTPTSRSRSPTASSRSR